MCPNAKLNALIKAQIKLQYPNGPTPHQKVLRKESPKSEGEEALWFQITKLTQLPKPEREVRLIEGRNWRYDFVWMAKKLIVEVEGGIWTGGRHVRPKGFTEDLRKYQAAQNLGFVVCRVTTEMVNRGEALSMIEELLR